MSDSFQNWTTGDWSVWSASYIITLFTVRLWSENTCSCLDRPERPRFHTTTAPFVAAVANVFSENIF